MAADLVVVPSLLALAPASSRAIELTRPGTTRHSLVRQAAPRSVLGSHGRAVVKSLISTWVHAFEDRIVAAARPGGSSIYCASSALPGTRRKCLKLPYGLLP
jgi:hypothetical protein